MLMSFFAEMQSAVMTSFVGVDCGSFPSSTTRIIRSRSVKIPARISPSPTTATAPTRRSFIKRTASWTVESGDTVTARWIGGRIQVEVLGEVVGSAAVGEEITVHLATGLRVRALVEDARTVVFPIPNANESGYAPAKKSDDR